MKKLILLIAISFNLSCVTAHQLTVPDTSYTQITVDTSNKFTVLVESDNKPERSVEEIAQDADLILKGVSAICPQLAPYTSIIGIVLTTITSLITLRSRRNWKRKHDNLIKG